MKAPKFSATCLLALASVFAAPMLHAQSDYPTKTVRVVTPVGAGGSVDVLTRLVAHHLSEAMGQQFIVENRPGAAGTVGASAVSKAAPDGYTLLMTHNPPLTTNFALYKKLDYKWQDFEPIMVVAQAPVVLIVNPSLGYKSVADLVAGSKSNPKGLSVATTGNGSIGHFVVADMQRKLGAKLVGIPYKGGVPGTTAVSTGEAQAGVLDQASVTPFVRDGRVRALAIVGEKRSPALPDVPTLAELGISGSDIIAWVGFVAPAGTPKAIIKKLSTETAAMLQDEKVRQRLTNLGVAPVDGSTPESFAVYLKEEVSRWGQRVKDAGLRIE